MKIFRTKFKDLLIIKCRSFKDKRGILRFAFDDRILKKKFVFEYSTISKKNVFRGFHFQYKFQQIKFITVLKGKILDCVIDLRKDSKTFGKVFKIILSEKNDLSLYVPAGFAHSYLTLENHNIVYYKLSNYYQPKYESGIIWNDKDLKIKWPTKKLKVSRKDQKLPTYKNFIENFKYL